MPLSAGLFKDQDQTEQDLTQGPGWTIDQQKPGFWDGMGITPAVRGIGEGAADGISMLTHGLQRLQNASIDPTVAGAFGPMGVAAAAGAQAAAKAVPSDVFAETERSTREVAKSLVADPRTTGVAANIVQGFSKAATEFGLGSLAGGPASGAALVGASEGYAHYNNLLDQGVDEATARKSGLLTAVTSGGGAILPMGMPAKWLAGLSTTGTLLAQAGVGAAANTAFGAASRYASAKILDDAGYHEMAAQQKPWDETNLLTDILTGAFFGAHTGLHGLKELRAETLDPSLHDAASVVQDRQAAVDAAPGIPVDLRSAAVHRQALEAALADLTAGRPVDLDHLDTEGATFAHVEENSSESQQIMRDAFVKSGVLDDAEAFDRWLSGEKEPEVVTEKPAPAAAKPAQGEPMQAAELAAAQEGIEKPGNEGEQDQEPSQFPASILQDRPDLQIVDEHGETQSAAEAQQQAIAEEAQANKEADPMFQAAVQCEARHA